MIWYYACTCRSMFAGHNYTQHPLSILQLMASKYYEPCPRWSHYIISIGGKVYLWGGRLENFTAQRRKQLSAVIEIYDPCLEIWEQRSTTGVPPPGLYDGGCTSLSNSLITFGGDDGKYVFNGLHKLNTTTLHWNELSIRNPSEGPMPKKGCSLVSFQGDKLALIGGGGNTPQWTNDFHLFDVPKGMLQFVFLPYTDSGNKVGTIKLA